MKDKSLITSAALGCAIVLGLATTVTASIYDVSFTATDGSTVTASGSVNVTGGVATSGTVNVSGPGWLTFPGTYSLNTDNGPYAALNGSATPYDADQSPDTNPNAQPYEFTGSLTAGAVPEPKTIISALLMLLPFGASALRILRKRQVA